MNSKPDYGVGKRVAEVTVHKADGSTYTRNQKVGRKEADGQAHRDADADVGSDLAAPRTGSAHEFETKYTEVPTYASESLWSADEVNSIDNTRVWTVSDGDVPVMVAGFQTHNAFRGENSYIVTETPWTNEKESYWWGQSNEDRMVDLAREALDTELSDDSRVYSAREAIEISDFGGDWSEILDEDDSDEFDELCDDDAKVLAAVNGLRADGITEHQLHGFGSAVAERLWLDRNKAVPEQIAVTDERAGEKAEWRRLVATLADTDSLATFATPDTEEHMVLGALENPIVTPEIIDKAARHDSMAVRRAAVMHPLVEKLTLDRLRVESLKNAEVFHGHATSATEPEVMKPIFAQQATENRDLAADIYHLLADPEARRRRAREYRK